MRQYDNATTVANEGEILASFQSRSLLSYQAYHIKDIKYGSQNRSTMDFFPLEHANKTVILYTEVIGSGVINLTLPL